MHTVRSATPSDAAAISVLAESVTEFSVRDNTVTFWPKPVLERAITSPDVVVLVAEDESRLIGFIIANYNQGLRKAHIENIYVVPDNRGKGVGESLLSSLSDRLQEVGCEYIATLVPPDASAAMTLYTRSGFGKGKQFVWLDKHLSDTFKKTA